jgi:hypothetical protein
MKTHGLSDAFKRAELYPDKEATFTIFTIENGTIHKLTKDVIPWESVLWRGGELRGRTIVSDWEIEELKMVED